MMAVGGFFFAEEAVRAVSSESSRDLVFQRLKFDEETTHDVV